MKAQKQSGFETALFEAPEHDGRTRDRNDRRSGRRFPLALEVRFRLRSARTPIQGVGRTCNISSTGVFFECDDILPRGEEVELSIGWPAKLDGVRPLKLLIVGHTLRSDARGTAVRTSNYEFRVLARPPALQATATSSLLASRSS